MKIDALFISDLHLGTKHSNSENILKLLKLYTPEYIFLVGDIIDGWRMKNKNNWKQSHTNILRKILSYSKEGTKVIYITGNHDDFLREYDNLIFGNIEIHTEYIWNNIFITHGDLYDGIVKLKYLGIIGSIGYDIAISFDKFIKKFGVRRSLSNYLKRKVKEAMKFITNFENELIRQTKKRNCNTIICGHIHKPEDKIIDNIRYLNCGDWIEHNSYIIYNNNKFILNEFK
jgi:UDP-2,3-diacylglucosamine pyrophosphatase LpxH